MGKYGPEKIPYFDAFHAVYLKEINFPDLLNFALIYSQIFKIVYI